MVSKSSLVWLLLFAMLALCTCTEKVSANTYCPAGNLEGVWRVTYASRCYDNKDYDNCPRWCQNRGRTFAQKFIKDVPLGSYQHDCVCCCKGAIPQPSPSPPPPSPPLPSPPPPPPPSDPRDLCYPSEVSLSTIVTDCSLCPVCNCGAGATLALEGCIDNYCSCCCLPTLTSTTPGSSLQLQRE
ncbi:hypothetical protein MKW92_005513 [Papaver armeniacum]|nr:hypothetical protein MKW92_005513 [Papaver armeniacum]